MMIDNQVLFADLIPLPITGLDIILGINWLGCHHAIIDCHHKIVTFCIPNREKFQFIGKKPCRSHLFISTIRAKKLFK